VADNSFRISFKAGILFILVFLVNFFVIWHFHNRFWWPFDDGYYAHVAERLLEGDVLHRDVQEQHGGYINFVNATALHFFGRRLVSLRYPIAFLTLIQACVVYFLFMSKGAWIAFVASLCITCFSFIQFLNPTPNWYCLFLAIVLVLSFRYRSNGSFMAGFIVGMVFLFRQLTGVFIAMAAFIYLLIERQDKLEDQKHGFLAKAILILCAIGVAIYLSFATDLVGIILVGIWPFLLIVRSAFLVQRNNKEVSKLSARFLSGFLMAFVPLLIYHLMHGSVYAWFKDTLLEVMHIMHFPHLKGPSYQYLLWGGVFQMSESHGDMYRLLNGLYWVLLPYIHLCNGVITFFALKKNVQALQKMYLPLIACFYSLVALLSQHQLYLYYTVGLSLLSLIWVVSQRSLYQAKVASALVIFLSIVGVYSHAGQPFTRNVYETFGGTKKNYVSSDSLKRAGLWIPEEELTIYTQLMRLIETETVDEETIFVFPNNAEIYFLSERRNPFRFYNTALGLLTEADVEQTLSELSARPPKLIIFHVGDKYETPQIKPILNFVRNHYDLINTLSFFEIYRRR